MRFFACILDSYWRSYDIPSEEEASRLLTGSFSIANRKLLDC